MNRAGTRILALALGLAPSVLWAGGQGAGLSNPTIPDNTRVRTWLMNEPGEPPPRLVCVDQPATSCFDLVLEQPNPTFPTRVWSPDCPAGPALRNCRPDEVPGTSALTGKLSFSQTPDNAWVVTDVSAQHPFDGNCSSGIGTLGTISAPANYFEAFDPQVGDAPYADTLAVSLFAPLPASLACASWIQTRTTDAALTSASHLTFSIAGVESYVYVLYQNGATAPSWLTAAFAQTPSTLATDLGTLRVWKSNALYPIGASITLGGNQAGGGTATQMYLVVVRPPDAIQLCGSYTATVTLERPGVSTPVTTRSESSCYHQAGPAHEFLTPQPLQLPGGIGFLVRGSFSPLRCDELPFGDRLEFERSFGTTGLLSRVGLRLAAWKAMPAELCAADAQGFCTRRPAVAIMEPTGELATGSASGGACTFPIDFTDPGQTRAIQYGGPVPNVDTPSNTLLDAFALEYGLVKDVDVVLQMPFPAADEVRSFLRNGATQVALDNRASCSNFAANTDAIFDDSAASVPAVPAQCGDLTGRWKPAQPLSAFNNKPVKGLWTLGLYDVTHPFDNTSLNDWQLRIQTSFSQCSDGLDNDSDGKRDWDGAGVGAADPQCTSAATNAEAVASFSCGIGPELALLLAGLLAARGRQRRSSG